MALTPFFVYIELAVAVTGRLLRGLRATHPDEIGTHMTRSNIDPPRIALVGMNADLVMRTFQCLCDAGLRVHLVLQTGNYAASVFRRSRYCLAVHEVDLKSWCDAPADAVEPIKELCNRVGIDLLIPGDMPLTLLLATINQQLGIGTFPLASPQLLRQVGDKLSFAKLVRELDIPHPEFWTLCSEEEIERIPFQYPVVAKACNLDTGRGIKVCENAREIREHARSIASFPAEPLKLQQFIPGIDLCLGFLANRGEIVAWSIHRRTSVKYGTDMPSCEFLQNAGFLESGRRFVKATGYHGVGEIDARLDERDGIVKLIECNPRMWGSVHFAAFAGVNFALAGIAIATGQPIPADKCRQRDGIVNTPAGSIRLLKYRAERIPVWTAGTWRAWKQMMSDPLPWILPRKRKLGV